MIVLRSAAVVKQISFTVRPLKMSPKAATSKAIQIIIYIKLVYTGWLIISKFMCIYCMSLIVYYVILSAQYYALS
jgi:hypothetical protein